MSDEHDVKKAATRVARLYTYGRTPDPDDEADARRSLATARIDREIRNAARSGGTPLDNVQAGHLVGLLLSMCDVGGETGAAIERLTRMAVREAEDRRR